MILLIDNYDSFVYNLRRYFTRLGQTIEVVRNDAIDIASVLNGRYEAVVISPGPKSPDEAGRCIELVQKASHVVPMLGICLGHQILWQALGGQIRRALAPMHGVASSIKLVATSRIFLGLPDTFEAARYHSLSACTVAIPAELRVTAVANDGEVMAFEHRSLPLFGLQFHPESILTQFGYQMLANFLRCCHLPCPFDLPHSDLVNPPDHRQEQPANESDSEAVAVLPGSHWR
jgi:anthranilate synthase/aminodeoxychorismate synthase-like glutamine amidotransferase